MIKFIVKGILLTGGALSSISLGIILYMIKYGGFVFHNHNWLLPEILFLIFIGICLFIWSGNEYRFLLQKIYKGKKNT